MKKANNKSRDMKRRRAPDVVGKVITGDALRVLRSFPSGFVDLIMTSPPYADKRKKSYGGIKPNEFVDWFLPICDEMQRVLKPKGSFILNVKEGVQGGERQTYVLELILELKKKGWKWVEEYCWYKKMSFPGKWPNRFRDQWERCLHFTKANRFKMYQDSVKVPIGDWSKKRFKTMSKNDFLRYVSRNNRHFGRNVSNWIDRRRVYPHNVVILEDESYIGASNIIELSVEMNGNHSAAYPVELPSWFIRLFTKKDDVVLDPFVGSGTTAIAALLQARKFIGIERKKEYVEIARSNVNEVAQLSNRRKYRSSLKEEK